MGVNLVQRADGGLGLQGKDLDDGAFIAASVVWQPADVDRPFFVADRSLRVVDIRARVEVAGTDGSAVTAAIKKVASGTALGSGTALHSGSVDLKGTAATNQALTLSTTAGVLDLTPGDALAIDFTGTLTSAVGVATVHMLPK
jgi:hypothetical protein